MWGWGLVMVMVLEGCGESTRLTETGCGVCDIGGKCVGKMYSSLNGGVRYLKGTLSLGLWYLKCLGFDLKGYSESDYDGCNMDRKSTSGAYQLLGGKLVCWSAKKQQSVAMSSVEAEM
ncbi:hypothetical protein Tco_0687318 [Tanacetum coccineum]